jgi:colicin import membrane protein
MAELKKERAYSKQLLEQAAQGTLTHQTRIAALEAEIAALRTAATTSADESRQRVATLEETLRVAHETAAEAVAAYEDAMHQTKQASQEADAARAAAEQAQAQATAATDTLALAQTAVQEQRARADALEAALARAQSSIQFAADEAASADPSALAEAEISLADLKEKLIAAEDDLRLTERRAAAAEAALAASKHAAGELAAELARARDEMGGITAARQAAAQAETETAHLRALVDKTSSDVLAAQAELAAARRDADQIRDQFDEKVSLKLAGPAVSHPNRCRRNRRCVRPLRWPLSSERRWRWR